MRTLQILKLDKHDPALVAAIAMRAHLGGDDIIEMLHMRHRGATLGDIATRFDMPKTTAAYKLEVAEAKCTAIRDELAGIAQSANAGAPSSKCQ